MHSSLYQIAQQKAEAAVSLYEDSDILESRLDLIEKIAPGAGRAIFRKIQEHVIDNYPDTPGHKGTATSRQAAHDIKPKQRHLQQRVLDSIRASIFGMSPEQIAEAIGESVYSVRPRCSELARKGLIKDSGRRGKTDFGKASISWVAV